MHPEAQNDLETFIHKRLSHLPESAAPESLGRNVLAKIAAREKLPWWKQPFTRWPRGAQFLFSAGLAILCAGGFWLLSGPIEHLAESEFWIRSRSILLVREWAGAMEDSLLLLLRNMTWQWFAALGALFAVMYSACLAGGFALYKVASRGSQGS
jgi:hypothetical protein